MLKGRKRARHGGAESLGRLKAYRQKAALSIVLVATSIFTLGLVERSLKIGLSGTEIVPVKLNGSFQFALKCQYKGHFRDHFITIEPVKPNATDIDRTICPSEEEAARKIVVKQDN